MSRFPSLTAENAPTEIRPVLAASQQKFGFLPSPVAKLAAAPVVLKHLLASFAAFERTTLSPLEREVVAMTVAFAHGCHYCMALHTAQLDHRAVADELRAGGPLTDPRLEALRVFTRAVLDGKGRVPDATWRQFAEAGFTDEDALGVVLGVGVYALSTFANVLTDAELDAAFAPFAWTPPGA